jgi:Asp-tRNA(Asn)/Glu-tRNA(Gln) amidotransferase A subunit family amidase
MRHEYLRACGPQHQDNDGRLQGRAISPVEVLATTLAHAERVNPQINALFHVAGKKRWRWPRPPKSAGGAASPLSALDGVPVTIKDSINMVGWPYFHGAKPNRDLPPAREDSPPAARLKEAGAVIFAKTVMPDCGLLGAGVSSSHGIVRNPWRLSANTGGSSAGCGCFTRCRASGLMSVGSDIAGSVRLPAGHCGLAALKPTQGLIPHLASDTMRSAGPMGRSVARHRRHAQRSGAARQPGLLVAAAFRRRLCQKSRARREGLKIGVLLDMGFDPRPVPEVVAVVKAAARFSKMPGPMFPRFRRPSTMMPMMPSTASCRSGAMPRSSPSRPSGGARSLLPYPSGASRAAPTARSTMRIS